jgi:hypothetical protein
MAAKRGRSLHPAAWQYRRNLLLGSSAAAATTCNGFLWTFAGARIRTCTLAAHRKPTAMSQTTITTNFDQSLDIHLHFSP